MNNRYSTNNKDKKNVVKNVPPKKTESDTQEEKKVSFPVYALEVVTDIGLGIIAGLSVNICADFIGKIFGLKYIGVIIVQLFLITIVLYMIKIDTRYLYSTWRGETSYGIIFMAVFLAVQKNMIKLFENIYLEEENRFGIF